MPSGRLLVAAAVIIITVSMAAGDIGTATSYSPPYIPTNCHGNDPKQFPPGNLFVAVKEGLWDNGAACGRRYRLTCLSGQKYKNKTPCKAGKAVHVDVKVVDLCKKTPCPSTFLLTNDVFAAILKFPSATISVEYTQI